MRLALILILAVALLPACSREDPVDLDAVPAAHETEEGRLASIQAAFGSPLSRMADDDVTARQIQDHFESLVAAVNAGQTVRATEHFNFDLMLRSMSDSGSLAALNTEERRQFLAGMRQSAQASWFDPATSAFGGDSIRVTALEKSADGRLALAYTRTDIDGEGILLKMRWWLARTGESWAIYDFEYLNTGIRGSVLMATVASQLRGTVGRPQWVSSLPLLTQVQGVAVEGDFRGALRLLRSIDTRSYPAELRAVHANLMSFCLVELEEYAEALTYANKALADKADLPEARFWRGLALFNLERYEEAARDLQWYSDTLGSDPIALVWLGNCLTWLDRHNEAKEAFLASLEDTPTWSALTGLAVCLSIDESPDYQLLKTYFSRLRHPRRDYPEIAYDLWENHYLADALAVVNELYRAIAPGDLDLAWYSAELAIYNEDWDEAVKVLRAVLPNAPADRADGFRGQYWWAMASGGRAVEALNEAGRTREAFEGLSDNLVSIGNWDGVEALCKAWMEGNEKDPMLHYYHGLAEHFRDRFAEAAARFSTASELKPREEWLRDSVRWYWTEALFRQGRALDAYERVGPVEETFRQLVEQLAEAEESEQLAALIEMHAKAHPEDRVLVLARGELAWINEDWALAFAEWNRYFAARDFVSWLDRERMVRAALRGDAVEAATRWTRLEDGGADYYLLSILFVGSGKHSEAIQSLASLAALYEDQELAQGVFNGLYNDADIGDKLRGAEYQRIHERFPPPESDDDDAPGAE